MAKDQIRPRSQPPRRATMATGFCPRCGEPRLGGFQFCRKCGLDFNSPEVRAHVAPLPPQVSPTFWSQPQPTGHSSTKAIETAGGIAWIVSAMFTGYLALVQVGFASSGLGALSGLVNTLSFDATFNGVTAVVTLYFGARLLMDPPRGFLRGSTVWGVLSVAWGAFQIANGATYWAFYGSIVASAAAGILSYVAYSQRIPFEPELELDHDDPVEPELELDDDDPVELELANVTSDWTLPVVVRSYDPGDRGREAYGDEAELFELHDYVVSVVREGEVRTATYRKNAAGGADGPPTIVRIYEGQQQADAVALFEADAADLGSDGFLPIAQSWAAGQRSPAGSLEDASGALTVTYARQTATSAREVPRTPERAEVDPADPLP